MNPRPVSLERVDADRIRLRLADSTRRRLEQRCDGGAATASTLGMDARRVDTGLTLVVLRGLGV